jgi:acyl-CoA hydrolase
MPRTFGDSLIHVSHIDVLVNGNSPIHESAQHTVGDDENRIAQLIADNLIDDGATLQMGI